MISIPKTPDDTARAVRELLAARLWESTLIAGANTPPWRHPSHAELRDNWRQAADALLSVLEKDGIRIRASSHAKLTEALTVLVTEPAHLAYTLPGTVQ